ncbi:N-acetylmuramoyl-L-alanine amidase [Litorimonas sp. RW-G-Af-16]|uniref:N-acetylmuramoyl-L-alanine amidase family protein n=1 Tax=Litorimonas sp. RW-G-Af-16 TaxID=3241168 RepID=UPI003AAABED7
MIVCSVLAMFSLADAQQRADGPRYFKNTTPYPALKPSVKKVPAKPVIVIDPGHGGKDPGAIGSKGTHEKVITLSAAKELRDMLVKSGKYQVIMTHTGKKYIDHETRLRIAREGGADLFISIHADSTSNKSARGASVYTLADRAKGRSKQNRQ